MRSRPQIIVIAVLSMCAVLNTAAPLHAQEDVPRTFRMGFTPFPYAISPEAVIWTYDHLAQDADLIVHHFDNGVPWTEALAGDRYDDNLMDDWRYRRAHVPDGHDLLVTVTPISITRDGLANYRGAQDDMPLPAPFDSYRFDHPDVITAFLRYCESAIDYFDPDYFMMGIEVNLLAKLRPDLWDSYVTLHRSVYRTLKSAYPDLPVLVSFTGIDLLSGYTDADLTMQQRAWTDMIDYTDIAAFSLYPYMTAYMTDRLPSGMFDDLAALTDKPLAVSETGYPAQSFHVGVGADLMFNSDATKQADYITLLLESAQAHEFVFVVNFVLRDYDALWQAIGGQEDLTIVWRDTGLYDESGEPRPALGVWHRWLARPLRE
jgi:hypothetical protein